jgi:RNA polymerase sigma-70 factor (ECF subfamily)
VGNRRYLQNSTVAAVVGAPPAGAARRRPDSLLAGTGPGEAGGGEAGGGEAGGGEAGGGEAGGGEAGGGEDQHLLARIAGGDQAAFAALFDRYSGAALGLAIKVCRDRCLAEEVIQEAFLSLWQRAANFDPQRGSVASYLLGAVHNKAVDAIRHEESLHRRQDASVAGFAAESRGDEVVEAAWLGVRRAEIRLAFAQLTPLQREALELAYFGGLTYSEVAERIGCPVGTAKTRLRDGMIRLRGLLGHLQEEATR